MPASSFGTGRFRWGINIDNMWVYAGAPQPKNLDAKQVVTGRIEGGLRGIFHGLTEPGRPSQPSPEIEEPPPELREHAREATIKLANELKKAGIDFVRCWFQWNFFEPTINHRPYRFPLDDFVSILNSESIEIVAVLGNGYSRFLPTGIDENDPKSYLTSLAEASTAIVRHYSNSIRIWQIENEPNWWFAHVASGWRHGMIWEEPGFHDTTLETFQRIIREESPTSTIVINLEADRKRTDWKSYSKYCDVLGLDFYPNYSKATPIDVSSFKYSAEVKSKTGLPVFIAETGYPSGPRYAGYSENEQAAYVSLACDEAHSLDAIDGVTFWRYSDSYWKSFPERENHFGLRTKEGDPKPSWIEYRQQIRKLAPGRRSD